MIEYVRNAMLSCFYSAIYLVPLSRYTSIRVLFIILNCRHSDREPRRLVHNELAKSRGCDLCEQRTFS